MAEMKTITINGSRYTLVDADAQQNIGDLDQLKTEQKESLVDAINELAEEISNVDDSSAIVCTETGTAVCVADASGRQLRGLTLYGKTTDGVNAGASGSIGVRVTGKNVLDFATMKTKDCVTNWEMFYAVYTLSAINVPVVPGQTYTISAYVKAEKVHTGLLTLSVQDGADVGYGKGTSLGSRAGATTEWKKVSITFTALSNWISISTNAQVRKDDIMLEPGGVATEYEPYTAQTLTIPTPNGLGDGEKIDLAKGVLIHNDGSETPLDADTLAAYAALHTNKPNTGVFNDAGVDMSVSYVADTKTYIDRSIDKKFAELSAALINNI